MDHVIGKKKSVFLIITGSMYQRINLSYKLKKSRKMFFKNNILSVKEKKKNKENMVHGKGMHRSRHGWYKEWGGENENLL
jgi:hypothetical protein